jgi:hypothetical protein
MKLSHILFKLSLILFFSIHANAIVGASDTNTTPSAATLPQQASPALEKEPAQNNGTETPAIASGDPAANANLEAAKPDAPIGKQLEPCLKMSSEVGKTLIPFCEKAISAAKACASKYQTSASLCNTDTNPDLLSTMAQIQAALSAVQGSGIVDSCSTFSKIMNLGKLGMAAYTAVCGVQQKLCDVACSDAVSSIEAVEAAIPAVSAKLTTCMAATPPNPEAAALCAKDQGIISSAIIAALKTEKTPEKNTIAGKTKVCKIDMLSLMGMGLMNVLSLAQAKGVSDKCEKETAADAKAAEQACSNVANKDRADCACTIAANKTLSYCATGLVDCGLSENADKPLCICKANPRMKGCEGVSTSLATNSALNSGNGSGLSTSRTPGSLTGTPATATDAINLFPNKKGNGQDGVGSASFGGASGAGLSGGSASSTDATDKAAAAAGAKDSANILESGGGGGGGGRGIGSTYTSPEYRSKLKAFAAKNGIGSKIAGSSWGDQVTATGGKSNFDKVKARYQENKSTLLAK